MQRFSFSFFLSGKTPCPGRLVFVVALANTKVHRYEQQEIERRHTDEEKVTLANNFYLTMADQWI